MYKLCIFHVMQEKLQTIIENSGKNKKRLFKFGENLRNKVRIKTAGK